MYITFVWMVLIKSHRPRDVIQLLPVGASISGCSLDPSTPPHFHWKLGFLEKFMRLRHVSFILCSWAFLTEGQELWNFSFSAFSLIWLRLGRRENEVWGKWSYGNVLNGMRGCSRRPVNEGRTASCLSVCASDKVIKGRTGHMGSFSHASATLLLPSSRMMVAVIVDYGTGKGQHWTFVSIQNGHLPMTSVNNCSNDS